MTVDAKTKEFANVYLANVKAEAELYGVRVLVSEDRKIIENGAWV